MNGKYVLILLLLSSDLFAQDQSDYQYSVLFYNVENLFDCEDDSLTLDDEFTFNGNKHWSYKRYKQKLNQISKVILSINQWNSPTLIGLCEVENQKVINQLIFETGLNNLHYQSIHFESPDRRGIDVALLYKTTDFYPIDYYPINISDPNTNFLTRDILYAKGIILNNDTLHLFINHWPSKLGGTIQSEEKRMRVARILKAKTDSILQANHNANIILLGDFNADITSPSIQYLLQNQLFYTLLDPLEINTEIIGGSHKYQGIWSLIDHIFISNGLMNNTNLKLTHQIANLQWLTEEDLTYSGVKPKRTYSGPRYIGGPSDHLPVIFKVNKNKEGEQKSPYNP